MSGGGINPLKDDNKKVIGYQFTVTNNAGYELPSTGGPGTNHIYFLGCMLTGVVGAGLMMWKRREEP